MTRPTTKEIIEGIGLLAIVASLIFLAIEVRQNTQAIDASEMNNIWSGWREVVILPILENPQFAEAVVKRATGEVLTDTEQAQLFVFSVGQFDVWAQIFALHKDGLIPDEKWEYWDAGIWNRNDDIGICGTFLGELSS